MGIDVICILEYLQEKWVVVLKCVNAEIRFGISNESCLENGYLGLLKYDWSIDLLNGRIHHDNMEA